MREKHTQKIIATKLQGVRWAIVSDGDYVKLSWEDALRAYNGRPFGLPKKNVSNFAIALQQKARMM